MISYIDSIRLRLDRHASREWLSPQPFELKCNDKSSDIKLFLPKEFMNNLRAQNKNYSLFLFLFFLKSNNILIAFGR